MSTELNRDPVLKVENLDIVYRMNDKPDVHAVSDASFTIRPGEYFGLVGESGCGKSTLAKAINGGMDPNGEITSGTIEFRGEEIQDFSESQFRNRIRWKNISLIPQSSMNSLDPTMRISKQAIEIADRHTDWEKERAVERLRELFEIVGLPESRIYDYPHEFSGGMQQRAIIALAFFLEPPLVIADEPTTALDVIMQDQIIEHLNRIKYEQDISMLLITHDISVVIENCERMAVMHGGQVAESGTVVDLFDRPRHPYTILLQEAFPDIRFPDQELGIIEGSPPQLTETVDYCTFYDRCPWSTDECLDGAPPLDPVAEDGSGDHRAACIRKHEMETLASDHLAESVPQPEREQ